MASHSTPAEGNYSFLLHTDSAVSSNSATEVDTAGFHRQKRRRTSPRDHAILEAAYLKNSKPDKHERADIVNQVELGEKEVQIWFQNRRQNDRRKTKPLQPHELLAHLRNGVPTQNPQNGTNESDATLHTTEATTGALDASRPLSRSSSIHELLNPPSIGSKRARDDHLSQARSTGPLPTPPSSFENAAREPTKPTALSNSTPCEPAVTKDLSHSRKRSHEVMTEEGVKANVPSLNNVPQLPQPKPLTRSSSFVRLAMTVDGAVKVRTNNEPTPSPPKQRTLPPIDPARKKECFGRSQSAVETGFDFKDINPTVRKAGAAGFGRSRDARTWEFYCDRDSGDALSTQAEAERSGSAVGAINLIRSRNQRNKSQALSPNPLKQNTRRMPAEQRHGKPRLSRTMSSMARLQSLDRTSEPAPGDEKQSKHEKSPSGDSDKENWAPGTRSSNHPMRRMHPSGNRGSVLQESDFPSAREPASGIIAQEQENKGVVGQGKAKTDDLDCIQGLLSLSQGAWQ